MGKYEAGYSKEFREKFDYAIDIPLLFARNLTPFSRVDGINIHHMAIYTATPERIHKGHLNRGWKGAAYNMYVRKDGRVYFMRGDKIGGHTFGQSSHIVGIGFEGYYHPRSSGAYDKAMPQAQFESGVRVIKDLLEFYPSAGFVKGHKDTTLVGHGTVCPGNYFPLGKMIEAVYKDDQPTTFETLRYTNPYMKSANVLKLQKRLIELGYGKVIGKADGIFGPKTCKGVMYYQENVLINGVVDKALWDKLFV